MTSPPPTPSPPPRPSRKLRPSRIPLLLLAHPFELAIALLMAVSVAHVAQRPQALAALLPRPLVYSWVALGLVSVFALTAGLLWRHQAAGRAVEKAGLYLMAGTMLAYAIAFGAALPFAEAWPVVTQLGAIGVASVLRAIAIRRTERIVLNQLRNATADQLRDLVDGRPPRGTR